MKVFTLFLVGIMIGFFVPFPIATVLVLVFNIHPTIALLIPQFCVVVVGIIGLEYEYRTRKRD